MYFECLGNDLPSFGSFPFYRMKQITNSKAEIQQSNQQQVKRVIQFYHINYLSQVMMDQQKIMSRNKNSADVNKLDIEFHLSTKSGMRTNYGNRFKTRSMHRGDTQKSQQNYEFIPEKTGNHQNNFQANQQIKTNQNFLNTVHNIRYGKFNSTNAKMNKTRSDFNMSFDEAYRQSHNFTKCPSFIPKNQRSSSVNTNITHTHLHNEKSKLGSNSLDSFQIKSIGSRPVNTGNNFSEKNLFPTRKKKSGTQMLINMLLRHANRQEMQVMRYTKLKQQAQQKQNAKFKSKYRYLSQINKDNCQNMSHNTHLKIRRRNQHQRPFGCYFKIGLTSNNNQ